MTHARLYMPLRPGSDRALVVLGAFPDTGAGPPAVLSTVEVAERTGATVKEASRALCRLGDAMLVARAPGRRWQRTTVPGVPQPPRRPPPTTSAVPAALFETDGRATRVGESGWLAAAGVSARRRSVSPVAAAAEVVALRWCAHLLPGAVLRHGLVTDDPSHHLTIRVAHEGVESVVAVLPVDLAGETASVAERRLESDLASGAAAYLPVALSAGRPDAWAGRCLPCEDVRSWGRSDDRGTQVLSAPLDAVAATLFGADAATLSAAASAPHEVPMSRLRAIYAHVRDAGADDYATASAALSDDTPPAETVATLAAAVGP